MLPFTILSNSSLQYRSISVPVERKVLIKRTLPISSAPGAWQHLAPVSPADENDTAIILSAEQRYRALGKEDAIPRFQQLNRLLKNQKVRVVFPPTPICYLLWSRRCSVRHRSITSTLILHYISRGPQSSTTAQES